MIDAAPAIAFIFVGGAVGFGVAMLCYRKMLLDLIKVCDKYNEILSEFLDRAKQ